MGRLGDERLQQLSVDTMSQAKLNLVVIHSADLERSAQFYKALGVHMTLERHGSGPKHFAGRAGSVLLEIYPRKAGQASTGTRLGFRIASLARVFDELIAAGGSVASLPKKSPWGFRAVVVDPDGHRIELVIESPQT